MFALAILLVFASSITAEIVDRIAVSVGNQVITESQILEEIRVAAFLSHEVPEVNAEQKRKAAERLIEQTLIRRDMEFSHYPAALASEAEKAEQQIRSAYPSPVEFKQEIEKYKIAEEDLRHHLQWQLTLLRFIEYRFKPSIQVPEVDIKRYYERKLGEWRQQGVEEPPSLDESRADIEKILTQERVDQAVDRWLGDARTQVEILYRKEAFGE